MSTFITFLTDFGLQDDFVGTCHGVIKRIAPEAEIIDVTHGIEPHKVLQGAFVLANTLPYMPEGIHLAVVDPGVGTDRRAVVLRSADGRLFVGPDNGLLTPAAEQLGAIAGAWELVNSAYRLEPVSYTFHGRDIFAPAAAHLAVGVDPAELEPPLERYYAVAARTFADARRGDILLYEDAYWNVAVAINGGSAAETLSLRPGDEVRLRLR